MRKAKVATTKPRVAVQPVEPDPVVRAVDDVVEDAIDGMVEQLTEASGTRPAIDPAGRKRVRHGLTMSKDEYESLEVLKTRLQRLARPAKKSEVLRAGIAVLSGMSDDQLVAAVVAVPDLKPPRSSGAGASRSKK